MRRVHNGVVDGIDRVLRRLLRPMTFHMQCPRAMAALAADWRLANLHPVNASTQGSRLTGMADETTLAGFPLKSNLLGSIIAGGHPPLIAGPIPGDGGLHQKAFRFHEVGQGMVPRAH